MDIKYYERNVKVFLYYRFFNNMLIIGPVLMLFLLWKGLNYTNIMVLQSISAISVILFEVPTGMVSDKITRHLALFLGSLLCFMGLLLYILGHSFLIFAFAEITFGLGITFTSGSDTSLLYESLVKLDRKKEFQTIMGKTMSVVFIGQGVGAVISSLLYKINPLIPFIISLGFLVVAMIISSLFHDQGRQKSSGSYLSHILQSSKEVFTKKRILWALGFAIIMGIASRSSFWLYQPYFQAVKLDVAWYGVAFLFFNLAAAFSSHYLVNKFKEIRPRRLLLALLFIMGLSFLLPALHPAIYLIPVFALQQFVRGLYNPTMSFYINHQVEDHNRATVSSMVSMAASLGFAIFSPLSGYWLDRIGAIPTYFRMTWFTWSGFVLLLIFWRIHKRAKKRSCSS
ncbi:MAG: MFS transporter [Candidatus Stygibacter australis]|nr:MFS transporter [Candidatus Stygibacter australis]